MDDWSKYVDAINSRWSGSASANTRYIPWSEMLNRTEELRDRLRDSIPCGNWTFKREFDAVWNTEDVSDNVVEPINIDEII